ncbi:MAG: 4Fe-4S binding protein [Firmicutes bacterium]|nr:4Fe-4S binding protein [Bacillota bacterium]
MAEISNHYADSRKAIVERLEFAGYRAAFLPYSSIARITEIYDALSENSGNTEFIQGTVNHFHSKLPPDIPFEPLSFLITAYPCPEWDIRLNYKGGQVTLPIPPAYIDPDAPTRRRLKEARDAVAKDHQMTETHGVSIKLLAVLSGLGKYGRNNIFYSNDFGSYCTLEAYFTDIPCENRECTASFMDICEGCRLCEENCPTGAIGAHPVIDVTRCLTMLNESNDPMPDWVPRDAHHALIGCMRCQDVCPANKTARTWDRGHIELDEAETEALLSLPPEDPPRELTHKLKEFGMSEWQIMNVNGRNARLAIEARGLL